LDDSTIYQALRTVVDPGLAESVVDLGWIQSVRLQPPAHVTVEMALPTPHYPHVDEIVTRVEQIITALPGVDQVDVRLIWDPPWTPYRMAGSLKTCLGLPDQEPADSVQPTPGRRSWLARLFGR
jgi:metal-sulfur cluster biosynthetic enzyme